MCSAREAPILKCAHWACIQINMAFCPKPPRSGLHCLGKKRRKWRLEQGGAWRNREKALRLRSGLQKIPSRSGLQKIPLLSPLHPGPASHLQCPLPPHHQSNLTHLSRKPGHPCPKVHLLKTLAALAVPTTHLAISPSPTWWLAWCWLPWLCLVSPARQWVPWEQSPGFLPLGLSTGHSSKMCAPITLPSHSPQYPLEFSVWSDLSMLSIKIICPPPCICTCCFSSTNAPSSPSLPVRIIPIAQGLAGYSRNRSLQLRKTCI